MHAHRGLALRVSKILRVPSWAEAARREALVGHHATPLTQASPKAPWFEAAPAALPPAPTRVSLHGKRREGDTGKRGAGKRRERDEGGREIGEREEEKEAGRKEAERQKREVGAKMGS